MLCAFRPRANVKQEYYHFFLAFSLLDGLGTSLASSPVITCIGHFFHRRRGLALGIASCSGSIGGIIFPSMLSSLLTTVGFARATGALGSVFLILLIIATIAIGSRLPAKPLSRVNVLPALGIFVSHQEGRNVLSE